MKLLSSRGHSNPLGGKCIHGKEGARLYAGALFNPTCKECIKMQEGKHERTS